MLFFALLVSLLLSPSRAVVTEVATQYGRIKGNYEQQHGVSYPAPLLLLPSFPQQLVVFYGVPFAAPPTGDLRLKPPVRLGPFSPFSAQSSFKVAPTPWKDVRDCTRGAVGEKGGAGCDWSHSSPFSPSTFAHRLVKIPEPCL